jgi:Zn finger protein HypA/HybF involved in hydrogenase expression
LHKSVYSDRILQSVLEAAGAAERPPQGAKVDVEEILGLTRVSLAMAYGILSKGTGGKDSRLAVKFTRGSADYPKCEFSGRLPVCRHDNTTYPAFACPQCGSSLMAVEVLEVKITRIE